MTKGVQQATWAKWRRWIDKIEADLATLIDDQGSFKVVGTVVEQNSEWMTSHGGEWFIDLLGRTYAAGTIMGIRRHLKKGDTSVSLMRLLEDVVAVADSISFDFYLSVFPAEDGPPDWQRVVFADLSCDGCTVTAATVQEDIDEARRLNAKLEEVADRRVAHLDRRGTEAVVTFDDLRASLDHFDKLACKYIRFFTGVLQANASLKATVTFDKMEIFQHPFVKPSP